MADETIPALPRTIAELPFFATGRHPKPDLMGRCGPDGIRPIAGRDLVERVRDISLGLARLGLTRGDRVAMLAESRPDWLLCDFAVLAAGAVTVPIYPTLAAEQVAFILRDAGVRIVIASTDVQTAKVLAVAATVPSLQAVVTMEPSGSLAAPAGLQVASLTDVAEQGHQAIRDGWGVGRSFHDEARRVAPSDLATIIYTSGTTGQPKGVMLTHANLVANIEGVTQVLDLGHADTALSFLPLCHAFERLVAYVYLASGVSMIFAESLDTVPRDLRAVRPTVMTGVPRVFEKLHAKVLATGREAGGLRRRIFDWAVRLAEIRGERLPAGAALSLGQRVGSAVAERLVYRKIREGLGGRLRFAVSGSAPLRVDVARLFYGLGLPIIEGYGLTETAPVLTVMPLDRIRFGTVGPALPNVEIRIGADGEILARGPNVMAGYYNRPDETTAAIQDGWFHTGDIGSLDEAGYLRITDRKKELLVTSGGKKIAPQPIEAELRAHPLVTEAVLVGEQRNYPSVLLVPDVAALCRELAVERPQDPVAVRALLDRPDVTARYQQAVDGVNAKLAQFERLKRFTLLGREFSLERGELTPTLKVKRRVVTDRFREEIERMYA